MTSTRFRDLSPAGKVVAWIAMAISIAIIGAAERDIHHRADEEVAGSKVLWRLASLNALGALSYFRWGRRPVSA
jgi:hypothetical protein